MNMREKNKPFLLTFLTEEILRHQKASWRPSVTSSTGDTSHGALQPLESSWEKSLTQNAKPRSCLMGLCQHQPAGRRCSLSASCVNTCSWTRGPPSGLCTDQSNAASTTGGPTLCGQNWTDGLLSGSPCVLKPATRQYVLY